MTPALPGTHGSPAAVTGPAAALPSTASCGRWMHVLPHLDPRFGGITAAVPLLVEALRETTLCDAEIAAFCAEGEQAPPIAAQLPLTRWPMSRTAWLRDRALRRRFGDLVARADGLHIHGLWEHSTFMAAHWARALGKPYVLSAHGMLDPWALRQKRVKKALYGAAIERRTVRSAALLHALTEAEAADYARFLGPVAGPPVTVVPNGVTLPPARSPDLFLDRFPALRGQRLLLFLGRIHPKKGVGVLVRAWAQLARSYPEAHLVVAGPDFDGTRAGVEALIAELGLGARVTFTGMLADALKWSALAAAAVFVLPSLSEGFSVSVLEAMGTGLPVIVTPECHFPDVSSSAAGWITQSEIGPLTSSLAEFLSHADETNRAIGTRGRDLVLRRFTWPAVAHAIAAQYSALHRAAARSQASTTTAEDLP